MACYVSSLCLLVLGLCLVRAQYSVLLLTTTNSNAYDELAIQGAQAACKLPNCSLSTSLVTALRAQIDEAVAQGKNHIITVGSQYGPETVLAALYYPQVRFSTVDYENTLEASNLELLSFEDDEGGFLAGALAGAVAASRNRKVGVLGGLAALAPSIMWVQGFANGVRNTCTNCTVLCQYTASVDNATEGQQWARAFLSQGVDVVFGAHGGATASSAIYYSAEMGTYVIGVDTDEYYTLFGGGSDAGGRFLLSSALKRVDVAINDTISRSIGGQFSGGSHIYGAGTGLQLAQCHSACAVYTDLISAAVAQVEEALIAGTRHTFIDRSGFNWLGDQCTYLGSMASVTTTASGSTSVVVTTSPTTTTTGASTSAATTTSSSSTSSSSTSSSTTSSSTSSSSTTTSFAPTTTHSTTTTTSSSSNNNVIPQSDTGSSLETAATSSNSSTPGAITISILVAILFVALWVRDCVVSARRDHLQNLVARGAPLLPGPSQP